MSGGPPLSGAWATEPSSGASAERYERLERIASGGMGVVWRVRDRVLNRDVAYKTVATGASDDARSRLVQEARLAAQLAEPGVIRVYDHGTRDDGRPFYVMELIDFPLLGRGRDEDCRSLVAVAHTVGHAHARGLVHRDLKPSNLGRRGKQPVVADWGLARPVSDVEHWERSVLVGERALTRTGVALGTAGYMAPEQLTGASADRRSDVWSLATMLHEVLTGRSPYSVDGSHRLMNEAVSGALNLPTGPVAEVARRGLQLDPAQRYSDATAFAEALEDALISEQPATSPRRSWLPVALGLGIAALAIPVAWRSPPAVSDTSALSAALAEAGWMHLRAGRTLLARERALAADAAQSTPWTRGLLMSPVADAPVPAFTPADCLHTELDPVAPYLLCTRESSLALYHRDGELQWERDVDGLRTARVDGGTVSYAAGFTGYRVDAQGNATEASLRLVNSEEFLFVGELGLRRAGDQLAGGADVISGVAWLGPSTGEAVLLDRSNDESSVLFADGTVVPGPTMDEPWAGWAVHSDAVTVVGLRGGVWVFDPSTWELRQHYRLRDVSQVRAATVSPRGEVAISTDDGVFLYDHDRVIQQITRQPSTALAFRGDRQLDLMLDQTLHSWRLSAAAQRLGLTRYNSVTALRTYRDNLLSVGAAGSVGSVHVLTLDGSLVKVTDLPVRDLLYDGNQSYAVDAIGTFTWPPQDYLMRTTAACLLADGTLIGTRRRHNGVEWRRGESHYTRTDTPAFPRIVAAVQREFAWALDDAGSVWKITPERDITPTETSGVDDLFDTNWGLLTVRDGNTVALDGRELATLEHRITKLYANERWVMAGTFNGEVHLWAPDGREVAALKSHGERISALTVHGDYLFTGSWEPGLRRWDLAGLYGVD